METSTKKNAKDLLDACPSLELERNVSPHPVVTRTA